MCMVRQVTVPAGEGEPGVPRLPGKQNPHSNKTVTGLKLYHCDPDFIGRPNVTDGKTLKSLGHAFGVIWQVARSLWSLKCGAALQLVPGCHSESAHLACSSLESCT